MMGMSLALPGLGTMVMPPWLANFNLWMRLTLGIGQIRFNNIKARKSVAYNVVTSPGAISP